MIYPGDNFYIGKILDGETSEYRHIVNKYKDMAFTIAFRVMKNREDAEEIAQDAFLKAYNSLAAFRQKSKFSTWLYAIIYNAAISRTRKKQIEVQAIDNHITENYSFDEIINRIDEIDIEEKREFMNRSIAELDTNDSILLNLYYREEQSIDEISKITGLSNSNVKVKLHRIRKNILSQFNDHIKKKIPVNS